VTEPESIQQFDEERADGYDDRIRRIAPGYDTLHGLLSSVLTAALGDEAHLLVAGAGTGAEIAAMGEAHPDWRFTAVDPSSEMLARCRERMAGTVVDGRVEYVSERVEDLSTDQAFDGATSIFVSHFLQTRDAKEQYFGSIARRLRSGAPFVVADLYEPNGAEPLWAAWQEWFAGTGASDEEVERVFSKMEDEISFVPESELSHILQTTGFAELTRVYQSFLWGAWWTQCS
jgi:tRNA (cmo5U34)-methyltransferase